MAVLTLTGVYRSGASPGAVDLPAATPQRIDWPRGEDGSLNLSVTQDDGSAASLTGNVLFTVSRRNAAPGEPPLVQKTVAVTAASTATIPLASADTKNLAEIVYAYDVWYVASGGSRAQLVPSSRFVVAGAVTNAP